MEAEETAVQRAARLAGGSLSALARLIGLTPQAVQAWTKGGFPSIESAIRIEEALSGAVTRADLLPHVYGPRPQSVRLA